MSTWAPDSNQKASRRRSGRVLLHVPVAVSSDDQAAGFSETSTTLAISLHGALIPLKAKVNESQTLFISAAGSEKLPCKVVYVGATLQGRTQVGIEFTAPAPNFWHITFPPDDWAANPDLAEVEKKK
jgi:PilZ domain